jgi:HTH-type transcriptional regulator / antitoxin HigA
MSSTAARPGYASLLAKTLPAVIHTERENEHYLAILEELDNRQRLTRDEKRLAELLTLLIEDFEERNYALTPAQPVEVLLELMQANNLKQKDLLDVFVTPSIVSEILSGRRNLTTEHIRKLCRRFEVSPEVFF